MPLRIFFFSCNADSKSHFEEVVELFKTQFFAVMKKGMGRVARLTGVLPFATASVPFLLRLSYRCCHSIMVSAELQHVGKELTTTGTLLYYFGVFTFSEGSDIRVPNATVQCLGSLVPYATVRLGLQVGAKI